MADIDDLCKALASSEQILGSSDFSWFTKEQHSGAKKWEEWFGKNCSTDEIPDYDEDGHWGIDRYSIDIGYVVSAYRTRDNKGTIFIEENFKGYLPDSALATMPSLGDWGDLVESED